MEYRRVGNKIIARMDAGEELVEKLTELTAAEQISFALICGGHGLVWKIHLETYDPAKYEAYENNYYDCYDMVSLTGELGGGEEPWLDAYAVIANVKLHSDMGFGDNITDREPGVAYGGRLKSAVVHVSCAVVLECVGLDAHLSDFTPPDIFKPGLLEKALKKYNKAEKLPSRRLEFD